MNFDLFDTINGKGVPCSTDMLMATIDTQKMRDRVQAVRDAVNAGRKDEAARLKKRLPAVTWQAHFPDGKRRSEGALSSGLYMLDIDGIEEVEKTIDAMLESATEQCILDQIVAVHISPSGKGIRVVAVCSDPQRDTIEKNQAWLAEKLGVVAYDAACKDFARLAFLVHYDDFRLLNLDLLASQPRVVLNNPLFSAEMTSDVGPQTTEAGENDNAVSKANTSTPSLGGGRGRLFTDEQRSFMYRGMLISDIAAAYLKKYGVPVEGERNTYYYNMCANFRYITDNNISVLLAQLPDIGLSITERQKVAESSIKGRRAGRIPYAFWKFLEELGLVTSERNKAAAEDEAKEAERLETMDAGTTKMPEMPLLFREFCRMVPDEFKWPMTAALLPILGTMTTRLRAKYIDGKPTSTTFHTVVIAPASSGKSIFRDVYNILCEDYMRRDAVEWEKERMYRKELRVKQNATTRPEDPHICIRLLSPAISVPRILGRQQDAGGLHQLTFTPEVDTVAKSNRGSAGMNKNDLYRQAWDNDVYGQDYMMADTFSGNVQLFVNFLLTGTPKQVQGFYGDAENGLVSRVMFAHIEGQEFAELPEFKELTEYGKETVNRCIERMNATCYKTLDNGKETILPVQDITPKMQFMYEPLRRWIESKRIEAMSEADLAKDNFRRRAAMKAFRAAMVAVGLYGKPNAHQQAAIVPWALWIADMDLKEHLAMYADQFNTAEHVKEYSVKNLLHELDDSFAMCDVIAVMSRAGRKSQPSVIVSGWKKAGLVIKTGKGIFAKTAKGKTI